MSPQMTFDANSVLTRALLTYLPEFSPHEVASVVTAVSHGKNESNISYLSSELQTQLLANVLRVFDMMSDDDVKMITKK